MYIVHNYNNADVIIAPSAALSDSNLCFIVEQIVEAFGYLGGYLGMWLGFSLLSILKSLQKKLFDFFFVSSTTKLTPVSRYGLSL